MQVAQEVKAYLLTNFLFTDDASAISEGTSLVEEGVVDSTGVLELIMYLEETYGISIADEEMIPENLDSLQRISRFVEGKRSSPPIAAAVRV